MLPQLETNLQLKKNLSWFSKSPNLSDSSPNCWHFIIYCHSAIYFLSFLLYRHSVVLTSLHPEYISSGSPLFPPSFSANCSLPSLHFKVKSSLSLSFPSHCRPPSANISHRLKSPILVLLSKHFFPRPFNTRFQQCFYGLWLLWLKIVT